jgi:predicted aldo/keto reductase-like oxidoreductase
MKDLPSNFEKTTDRKLSRQLPKSKDLFDCENMHRVTKLTARDLQVTRFADVHEHARASNKLRTAFFSEEDKINKNITTKSNKNTFKTIRMIKLHCMPNDEAYMRSA